MTYSIFELPSIKGRPCLRSAALPYLIDQVVPLRHSMTHWSLAAPRLHNTYQSAALVERIVCISAPNSTAYRAQPSNKILLFLPPVYQTSDFKPHFRAVRNVFWLLGARSDQSKTGELGETFEIHIATNTLLPSRYRNTNLPIRQQTSSNSRRPRQWKQSRGDEEGLPLRHIGRWDMQTSISTLQEHCIWYSA